MKDSAAPVLVHVAPHPDDEVLGAGATLIALREAGWRVINLACGLGRPDDQVRRRAELDDALLRLDFETVVIEPAIDLGSGGDRPAAAEAVRAAVRAVVADTGARLVVSPHLDDSHHGHVTVAEGVAAAVGQLADVVWWTWGLWADLRQPTLYHAFDGSRLMQQISAMEAYRGENERNSYIDLIPVRARATAILGSERVFGFGSSTASPLPYAEVLREVRYAQGRAHPGTPRILDPTDPLPPAEV